MRSTQTRSPPGGKLDAEMNSGLAAAPGPESQQEPQITALFERRMGSCVAVGFAGISKAARTEPAQSP